MAKECCANCTKRLNLLKFDYLPTGEVKHDYGMRGYICLAFAAEGDAIWMCRLNPENEICEMYKRKDGAD